MSDRVTNVEIEDVLSSIRRLVSNVSKEKPAPADTDDAVPPPPEKFVLTPALRVTDPEELAESPLPAADPDDVWTSGDAATFEEPTTFVLETAAEPAAEVVSDRNSLEATIAELEAAVTEQPDEWEPDGSEIKTVPTWDTVSYPALDDIEDAVAVEEEAGPRLAETATPYVVSEVANDTGYDDIARIGLTFESVRPEETPAQFADDDDEDVDYGDELVPDAPKVSEDEDIDAYLFGDGGVVDEAVLRQVVMEIVRDELQGKMGEKITRNVRKMVRREIHRVLTSQEFD